jgi:hypothetical protein
VQHLLAAREIVGWHVEFTGVELASGAKIATLVEKAAAGPVEKATAGLHIVQVEREQCEG